MAEHGELYKQTGFFHLVPRSVHVVVVSKECGLYTEGDENSILIRHSGPGPGDTIRGRLSVAQRPQAAQCPYCLDFPGKDD